jgi:AcrR family transcriptional regulator
MSAPILHDQATSRVRRSTVGEPRTQRARLVAAVGAVAWEQGSGSLTVDHICGHAGMSRRSFYDLFVNAEDALASAVEDAHERLWREVDQQVHAAPAPDWPTAMSTVVVAFLAAVERRPAAGWLCVGEPVTELPRAQAARRQLMSRLAAFITDGHDDDACKVDEWARGQTAMGAIGALWELVRQHLADRDPDRPLRALSGPAIFLVLVPYVGRTVAMRLATNPPVLSLATTGATDADAVMGQLTELARQTLRFLRDRPLASNAEVAEGIGVTHASQISRHLHRLAEEQLIAGSRDGRRNAWSLTERGARVVAALGTTKAGVSRRYTRPG